MKGFLGSMLCCPQAWSEVDRPPQPRPSTSTQWRGHDATPPSLPTLQTPEWTFPFRNSLALQHSTVDPPLRLAWTWRGVAMLIPPSSRPQAEHTPSDHVNKGEVRSQSQKPKPQAQGPYATMSSHPVYRSISIFPDDIPFQNPMAPFTVSK